MSCEVLIIGAGAAGLSAATVLGRSLRQVIVYDHGVRRNQSSRAMHAYLSRDGIDPAEFIDICKVQLRQYSSVEQRHGTAVKAEAAGRGFEVQFEDGSKQACQKLLLAAGVCDVLPEMPGISDFYGRSVHHCPYCDGWEHRGQTIAVYGADGKGPGLATMMLQWSDKIVLCTNGSQLTSKDTINLAAHGVRIRDEPILRCEGEQGKIQRLLFQSGPPLDCEALFFNTGQTRRSELVTQLGCRLDDKGSVETNEHEQSSVPGLYVAGDVSRDLQFVIMAAAEGARAGVAINAALQLEAGR